MNPLSALEFARRLEQIGVVVRSPELAAAAKDMNEFRARGGNRAMRRAAERARRSRGR